MVLRFFFVLDDLAVEFVDHIVNRRIHILLHIFGIELGTADLYRRFRFLLQLLNGQNDMHINDVVEMALDFADFLFDISFQRLGNFYVMACDTNLHGILLFLKIILPERLNMPFPLAG